MRRQLTFRKPALGAGSHPRLARGASYGVRPHRLAPYPERKRASRPERHRQTGGSKGFWSRLIAQSRPKPPRVAQTQKPFDPLADRSEETSRKRQRRNFPSVAYASGSFGFICWRLRRAYNSTAAACSSVSMEPGRRRRTRAMALAALSPRATK